jgi:multiple antibiotic resistance protein
MDAASLTTDTLYLLALINPISKISLLALFSADLSRSDLPRLALRSSLTAFVILLVFEFGGDLILHGLFHVDLYSLQIAGGVVIFFVGYNALTKGVFYDLDIRDRYREAAIVPLASPLIAGPATITAVISMAAERGYAHTSVPLLLALAINLALMLLAAPIASFLRSHNVLGALIRLTGLVVATMGVQMALAGLRAWLAVARPG